MADNDQIEYASLTDVGVRRSHNQDAHAVLPARDEEHWLEHGHIFMVADGMGAHAVGEMASELAASIIPLSYQKYAAQGADQALQKAIVEANGSIHERGQQNREFQGMGTTSTVLLLRLEGAWVGHVGDSRAYRLRDGRIEQLSFDHSLLWETARRKKIHPNQVQGVRNNVIVRSLGPEESVRVDVEGPHPLQKGDTFVLCSDGLSGQLADNEIGAIVGNLQPAEACQLLVDLANLRGGPDNITVIVVRVHGIESPPAPPPSPPPKPHWFLRIPWPMAVLSIGVILAAFAFYLTVSHAPEGPLVLVSSLACILLGVIGLLVHHLWEKNHPAAPVRVPRLKTYNHASCQVERAFLDKLTKAAADLENTIRENQWEADWNTLSQHQQRFENYLLEEDLAHALNEQCRILRSLSAVVQSHRQKEESFKPNWDKKRR